MSDIQSKVEELQRLELDVANLRRTLKADVIRQAQAIIDQFDLKSTDLSFSDLQAPRKATGRTPVAPKYRGPNGELWSGRGRSPRWVVAIEEAGQSREDYLIR